MPLEKPDHLQSLTCLPIDNVRDMFRQEHERYDSGCASAPSN